MAPRSGACERRARLAQADHAREDGRAPGRTEPARGRRPAPRPARPPSVGGGALARRGAGGRRPGATAARVEERGGAGGGRSRGREGGGGSPAREPLDPRHQLGEGHQPPHLHELQQRQVEGHARVRRVAQLGLGAGQHVEARAAGPPRRAPRPAAAAARAPRAGSRRGGRSPRARASRAGSRASAAAARGRSCGSRRRTRRGAPPARARRGCRRRRSRARRPVQQLAVDEAEQPGHVLVLHLVAAEGQHLVEERERVAHAALGGAGDLAEGRVGDLDLLRRPRPPRRCACSSVAGIMRKSYCWQRERIVSGILWYSVVAKMNLTRGRRLLERLQEGVESRPSRACGPRR